MCIGRDQARPYETPGKDADPGKGPAFKLMFRLSGPKKAIPIAQDCPNE
jgi:hypothetical protein